MAKLKVGNGMNHADWAEQTYVRIGRALRHFDWATSRELFEAMGIPSSGRDPMRLRYAKALSVLVQRGDIKMRGRYGCQEYHLVVAPVPPPLPPPLPEEGDERDGLVFLRSRWQCVAVLGERAYGKLCPNGHTLNAKTITTHGSRLRCGLCVSGQIRRRRAA